MLNTIERKASYTNIMFAANVRKINDVDHKKKGVFLFNYFSAKNTEQNLKVWEYTAGWFQKETGLNNSTLLLPVGERNFQYSIIRLEAPPGTGLAWVYKNTISQHEAQLC